MFLDVRQSALKMADFYFCYVGHLVTMNAPFLSLCITHSDILQSLSTISCSSIPKHTLFEFLYSYSTIWEELYGAVLSWLCGSTVLCVILCKSLVLSDGLEMKTLQGERSPLLTWNASPVPSRGISTSKLSSRSSSLKPPHLHQLQVQPSAPQVQLPLQVVRPPGAVVQAHQQAPGSRHRASSRRAPGSGWCRGDTFTINFYVIWFCVKIREFCIA